MLKTAFYPRLLPPGGGCHNNAKGEKCSNSEGFRASTKYQIEKRFAIKWKLHDDMEDKFDLIEA